MLHYMKVLGPEEPDERVAYRVREFFIMRGFRESPRMAPERLKFTRGSSVGTFFALDPGRWRIDVFVNVDLRAVQMFVHSDGHVVTPRERRYFDLLFHEVLVALCPSKFMMMRPAEEAQQAALNENVTVTFAFLMLLPLSMSIFHVAMAVPLFWSIVWGFGASISTAYAWLFSFRNRPDVQSGGVDALPTRHCHAQLAA